MPMEKEKHEEILNALVNPELDHTTRIELLQELRNDYTLVHEDVTTLTSTIEKTKSENSDLLLANAKLFLQQGVDTLPKADEKKKEEQSAKITLEDIEKGAI